MSCRENHGSLILDWMDPVEELGVRADHPPESHLYYRKVSVLKITPEEISWDLDREGRTDK